jgi:hypothetical protein
MPRDAAFIFVEGRVSSRPCEIPHPETMPAHLTFCCLPWFMQPDVFLYYADFVVRLPIRLDRIGYYDMFSTNANPNPQASRRTQTMLRKTIVALSICLWVMSGSARAECPEGSSQSGDYCYTHSGGNVTISKYLGAGGHVALPNTIEAMPVVHIGDEAFRDCTSLTGLTIPLSFNSIGINAFRGCTGLSFVTIPDSVATIGNFAFWGCTALTGVTIPASLTSIGWNTFWGCTGLTGIDVDPANANYSSEGGVLYNKTKTELIKYPSAKPVAAFSIPGSVTTIGWGAFGNCIFLTSVTIPDSVTSIGGSAFLDCASLASVVIGNSVNAIGDSVFSGCTSLISVTIPVGVTSIPSNTFFNCTSLTSVTIPDSVTSIWHAAFSGCSSLTSVTIPDGVTSIGGNAFEGCSSLTSVNIPDSVTSIGSSAFQGCSSLTGVTIGNSVTSIGSHAFRDCTSLTAVTIGNSVTSIGGSAFNNCSSLTGVFIPISVTSIGTSAFRDCSSLTSVHIPNSVNYIGISAFQGCSSLTGIIIPNGVTLIENSTFRNCGNLASITIPNSVTSIGFAAFSGCTSLTTAYFLGNAPTMGEHVFASCAPGFNICYTPRATGFTSPTWNGYPAADCACASDRDCDMDELCGENVCAQTPDTMRVDRATVKAGKVAGMDSMQFSGWMDATEADLNAAKGGDIIISIDAEDIPDLNETTYAFPVTDATIAKGRYRSPKVKPANKADPLLAFSFDSVKGTMKFSGKNLDLTGLSCPFTVLVQFGDYAAGIQVGADSVNGSKPCPLPLLMGVKDTLSADKLKAKKGKTIGTDSISVSGTFTAAGGFNQALPVIITIGPDTFTVAGDEFILSNDRYLCKKVNSGNGIIMARFDTVKCTYSISIKGADISGSGNVAFGIDIFGNELPPDEIALPAGF